MGNLIANYTSRRLVEYHYLHSNTNNFISVVNKEVKKIQPNEENEELEKIRKRLIELIKRSNEEINNFYNDMGIIERDTISDDGKRYNPAGANYFSNKYLMERIYKNEGDIKNINKNSTVEKILLSLINSQDSINALSSAMVTAFQSNEDVIVNFDEPVQKFFKVVEKNFNNNLIPKTQDKINQMTLREINTFINSFFIKTTERNAVRLNTDNKDIIKGLSKKTKGFEEFRTVIKEAFNIEEFTIRNKKYVNNLEQEIKRKVIYPKLYEMAAGLYYDNYLNVQYKAITGKALHGAKKRKFIRLLSKTMSGYKNLNFILDETTDKDKITGYQSGLRGLVLEFGLYGAFNLSQNYSKDIVKLVGQENVVRRYLTEKFDREGNILNENRDIVGESPSDISFVGNSGQIYYFQLKNNFNDISSALSYRSQAEIKANTFLPTALKNESQDVKDLLIYLLINSTYLQKYGLGKFQGKDTKEQIFNLNDYPLIKDYIIFFLEQSYQFLIGYKYEEKTNNVVKLTTGNLAYIFQGRYFIPVSAYFYSALEMLNKLIDSNYQMKGIGGVIMPKVLIDEGFTMPHRFIQARKQTKLAQQIYETKNETGLYGPDEIKYPSNLLAYGQEKGELLYDKLRFNRINITLIMDNLEKLFRT